MAAGCLATFVYIGGVVALWRLWSGPGAMWWIVFGALVAMFCTEGWLNNAVKYERANPHVDPRESNNLVVADIIATVVAAVVVIIGLVVSFQ